MDQSSQVRSWRAAISLAISGVSLLFNCCCRWEQMAGICHLSCTQPDPAGASQRVSTRGSTMEVPFPGYCIPAGARLGAPAEQLALPWGFGLVLSWLWWFVLSQPGFPRWLCCLGML